MIEVGIGEVAISNEKIEKIVTHALGSCVALILHCSNTKTTAMAHIVLPHRKADVHIRYGKEAYYVNDIVPKLLEYYMKGLTCDKQCLKAIIVGGAIQSTFDMYNIGQQNVQAVKQYLDNYQLVYDDTEVLGNFSRSVSVEVSTGMVTIKKQPFIFGKEI